MNGTSDILLDLFGEEIGYRNIALRMKLTILNGIDYAIESGYEIRNIEDWRNWGTYSIYDELNRYDVYLYFNIICDEIVEMEF